MEPQNDKNQDLVNVQQKIATLDQLLTNYNQLYTTYLQEVESEVNKKQQVQIKQVQNLSKIPLFKIPMYIDIYSGDKVERKKITLTKSDETFEFDVVLVVVVVVVVVILWASFLFLT